MIICNIIASIDASAYWISVFISHRYLSNIDLWVNQASKFIWSRSHFGAHRWALNSSRIWKFNNIPMYTGVSNLLITRIYMTWGSSLSFSFYKIHYLFLVYFFHSLCKHLFYSGSIKAQIMDITLTLFDVSPWTCAWICCRQILYWAI